MNPGSGSARHGTYDFVFLENILDKIGISSAHISTLVIAGIVVYAIYFYIKKYKGEKTKDTNEEDQQNGC